MSFCGSNVFFSEFEVTRHFYFSKVVFCRLCLKYDIVGWFLIPSSRWFHILLVDSIHDLEEICVRANDIEKLLLFLRGTPTSHLLMEELSLRIFPLLILCT